MTVLPNAGRAEVGQDKVAGYLLNRDNVQNSGKAALFERLGFSLIAWDVLASALRRHGQTNPVVKTDTTAYGAKHVVQCNLSTPSGEGPCMTTVWIVETGRETPRLVTAY